GVDRERGDLELAPHRPAVQGLDVPEQVLEAVAAGRDQPVGERVEHERVVGVRAVPESDEPFAHVSLRGRRGAGIVVDGGQADRRWRPDAAAGENPGVGGSLPIEIVTRFKVPLLILGAALVYGTVGYVAIFGWSGLDALYMTVMTLSTVGYREVHPLDTGGKAFTISLILLGVTALFTGLGILAQSAASGELGEIIRRSRVGRRIEQLKGHHIVCAYGRVG